MKRLLIVCAVSFFAMSGCTLNALQHQEVRIDEHMQRLSKPLPDVAQIFSHETQIIQVGPMLIPEDTPTWGSSFVYIDNEGRCGVYTANHVIGAAEKTAWVRMDGEKTAIEVPVVSRDSFFDMAVLECPRVQGVQIKSANLGSAEDISVGRVVYSVGFSNGIRSVTKGYVNSVNVPPDDPPYFFSHQSPLQPGDSGGILVVFDDKDEPVVIGMNAMIEKRGLRSYSISVRYLRRIMARLWDKRPGVEITFGAVMANIFQIPPRDYMDATKKPYPPPGDVVVANVQRGTPAEEAGLMQGDAIVGAHHPDGTDIPFASAEELLVEILLQTTADEAIFLSIIRDGKPLDVAVTLTAQKRE